MTEYGRHRLQAGQLFQKHPALAHGEVLALHQRIAQVTGEQGVLEIDTAVRSRREQDDAGVFLPKGGAL